MAGVQVLQEQKPAFAQKSHPAPALRAGWSNEGFESNLPTPDKAKSPLKRGLLLYLAETTAWTQEVGQRKERLPRQGLLGHPCPRPSGSLRSCRIAPGDPVEPKASHRTYLLLIKQKAP
jgi:hypothetical protein